MTTPTDEEKIVTIALSSTVEQIDIAAASRKGLKVKPVTRHTRSLGEVVDILRFNRPSASSSPALPSIACLPTSTAERPQTTEGVLLPSRLFSCADGSRDYKLYIPCGKRWQKRPLLVMLHGCSQSPDDFAAGTRMNAVAEASSMLVAYPAQSKAANSSGCWNWFDPKHQRRGAGEPAIIAGITQEIIANHNVDPACVFIAGLSAGGAMAVVMAATYPDLYSAVGAHSGLSYCCARDVVSAFAAMRRGSRNSSPTASVRTIVFHGDADRTVHVSNGMEIAGKEHSDHAAGFEAGHRASVGGKAYTKTITRNKEKVVEHWLIHGGGHAWSGGSSEGSFTDPQGPDASREMARFFLSPSA